MLEFGMYGFSKIIYCSGNCERFSMDHIELQTEINIPEIKSATCNDDKITKTKNSNFIIDTMKIDLEKYI